MGRLIEQQAVIDCLTNTAKYFDMPQADEWTKGIHYGLIHGLDNILDNVPTADAIPKAEYEFQKRNEYRRGYHDAIRKALKESFNIHCDEGNFKVVQEETLIGLGLSEDEALGDIISRENYEVRLKADMVAMLTELQLEIEEKRREEEFMNDWNNGYNSCLVDDYNFIQQKINELKGDKNEI